MCIKNIKITIYLQKELFPPYKSREKIFHFINSFHITIYKHSPSLVNVTKIKNHQDIIRSILSVKNFFNVDIKNYKVNCIMSSFKYKNCLKLELIPPILEFITQDYFLDFNPEIFSGCFLKSKIKGLFPTITLFHSGTVQVFSKSFEKTNEAHNLINSLLPVIERV